MADCIQAEALIDGTEISGIEAEHLLADRVMTPVKHWQWRGHAGWLGTNRRSGTGR